MPAPAHSANPALAARGPRQVLARLDRLTKTYGQPGSVVQVQALRQISLTFEEGEYVAICGHSGSGKSTLLNLLGCLDRPTSGRYILGDADVSQLDDDALSMIRCKRLGFVFQSFNLIPQLTVLENLEVPLFYQGVPPRERRERAVELISRVGLRDRMMHKPMELSGGQQQRVAIARALVNDPLVLLADEPTGNLDSTSGSDILKLFSELNEQGKTLILVTHDPSVGRSARRAIRLRDGEIESDVRN